ncbi:MAG: c-type cytochrome [Polyangia bacterium]
MRTRLSACSQPARLPLVGAKALGRLLVAAALAVPLSVPLLASAQWKDLQVLPPTTPKDVLKATMKLQAKALGKDCDFCHNMPDAAADHPMKKKAREMMKMVQAINKDYPAAEKHVTCWTCHRGAVHPENQAGAKK